MTAIARPAWSMPRLPLAGACVLACLLACLLPAAARAQEDVQPPADVAPRAARFELAVLGGVFGGGAIGETPATVLTNGVPNSGEAALFETRTSIATAPVVEGRFGVRLAGALWVEGGLSYATPDVVVDLSGDMEGAPGVTASTRLTQMTVDAGIQYRWQGRRITPFVMGGGGYLRQLDEPRTTVETGALFYGGGGARVRLSTAPSGWLSHLAVRADARVVWLRGGVSLEDDRGPAIVATGGLSLAF